MNVSQSPDYWSKCPVWLDVTKQMDQQNPPGSFSGVVVDHAKASLSRLPAGAAVPGHRAGAECAAPKEGRLRLNMGLRLVEFQGKHMIPSHVTCDIKSPSSALLSPFFRWEGSPTKIDKRETKSGTNLFQPLKSGGPSFVAALAGWACWLSLVEYTSSVLGST